MGSALDEKQEVYSLASDGSAQEAFAGGPAMAFPVLAFHWSTLHARTRVDISFGCGRHACGVSACRICAHCAAICRTNVLCEACDEAYWNEARLHARSARSRCPDRARPKARAIECGGCASDPPRSTRRSRSPTTRAAGRASLGLKFRARLMLAREFARTSCARSRQGDLGHEWPVYRAACRWPAKRLVERGYNQAWRDRQAIVARAPRASPTPDIARRVRRHRAAVALDLTRARPTCGRCVCCRSNRCRPARRHGRRRHDYRRDAGSVRAYAQGRRRRARHQFVALRTPKN